MGEVVKIDDLIKRKIKKGNILDGTKLDKLYRHYHRMKIWKMQVLTNNKEENENG